MDKVTNTLLNVYKSIMVGLVGIVGFFIVDIHRMVKEDHDGMIIYKEKIGVIESNIVELKDQNRTFESLFQKILATLPNNDFDVSPKHKQNESTE